MRISYNWLCALLPGVELGVEDAARCLTGIGLEVEAIEPASSVPGGLNGLVVGEVLTCAKHPNADRLSVTTVNVGQGDPLCIVCGAPNVRAGLRVVVATHGTKLYPLNGDPLTIKRSKVRGELSEGMICAEDEVGLGEGHDGILVLPPEAQVGDPAARWLGVENDYVLEVGLTANRADAMSHYGVARDLAAYLRQHGDAQAVLPEVALPEVALPGGPITIGSIDRTLCDCYCGLTIRGVTVQPSPKWLADRLRAIGLNPINNVVDVTNYVLHEVGQPLHAFDARCFTSGQVSVRLLAEGTPFTTLDAKPRSLSAEDAMVCDGATPLCMAGVLGGESSGVSEATTDIFLEAAVFNAVSIRRTAKRHGISTDASYRFERGVDAALTRYALRRAAALILEVAGGGIDGDLQEVAYVPERGYRNVRLNPGLLDRLLGLAVERDALERIFQGLEIEYSVDAEGGWDLRVPRYRVDVARPEDVAEEVLRIYGCDRVGIPGRMAIALPSVQHLQREPECADRVAQALAGRGFNEIMGLSLVAARTVGRLGSYAEEDVVLLQNPLSADLNALRPTLLLGALDAVARNAARQRPNLQLFEFGNVIRRTTSSKTLLPGYAEERKLSLALCGEITPAVWCQRAVRADLYSLKGNVDAVLQLVGIPEVSLTYGDAPVGYYADGVGLWQGKRLVGHFGQVAGHVLALYGIKIDVFFAELEWAYLCERMAMRATPYTAIPRFPEVRRDLALLLDGSVQFADLRRAAHRVEPKLRRVELFDVYEGEGIPSGKKSYALSFILQQPDATLNDRTIERAMERILQSLQREYGAELRG